MINNQISNRCVYNFRGKLYSNEFIETFNPRKRFLRVDTRWIVAIRIFSLPLSNNNTISRCIAILRIVANVATNSVRNHRLLRLPQFVTNVAERRWQSSAGIGYGRVQRRRWFPIYPWLNPLRIFFPTRFSVLGQGCSRIAVAKQKKEKKKKKHRTFGPIEKI